MNHSKLDELNACREAVEWYESFDTLQEAWDKCERGDWMLWYLGRTCGPPDTADHRTMTACKAACARLVLHIYEAKYPNDVRPRNAIEAAEEYSRGEITAYSAYSDADAYSAAAAAAYSAYSAYSAAAYSADAYSAARFAMLKQCAEEIRKIVPTI